MKLMIDSQGTRAASTAAGDAWSDAYADAGFSGGADQDASECTQVI